MTALLVAVAYRNVEVVQLLLNNHANVNASDKQGNTALLYAVRNKQLPMVELLLNNGATINHNNHGGENALLLACYDNNNSMVKLLVSKGADVTVASHEGISPIWYACGHNQKEIVTLFLDNGLDANYSKPVSGNDESMNAYMNWVESASNIAIESSFSLNGSYSYGGESLLHIAAKKGNLSMMKLLVERGARVNIQDESGIRPCIMLLPVVKRMR